jgi:hypothetical protein
MEGRRYATLSTSSEKHRAWLEAKMLVFEEANLEAEMKAIEEEERLLDQMEAELNKDVEELVDHILELKAKWREVFGDLSAFPANLHINAEIGIRRRKSISIDNRKLNLCRTFRIRNHLKKKEQNPLSVFGGWLSVKSGFLSQKRYYFELDLVSNYLSYYTNPPSLGVLEAKLVGNHPITRISTSLNQAVSI